MAAAVVPLTGPVDVVVIVFKGELDQGGIRAAVARAVDAGSVRVLDVLLVLLVLKNDDGSVELFDSESPEAAEELLGFQTDLPDLICEQDALATAAVLMLAWENVWAVEIASAIRDLDGQLLVMQRLPHEEVTAALQARDEITKEQS